MPRHNVATLDLDDLAVPRTRGRTPGPHPDADAGLPLDAWTALLDLPGFEVVDAAADPATATRTFTLAATAVAAPCPHCGRPTAQRHACYARTFLDLPLGPWATRLVVGQVQFRCGACDRYFTPRAPALTAGDGGAHATARFVARAADLLRHADVAGAATYLGVPEATLRRWYYDLLGRRLAGDVRDAAGAGLKPVTSLGIDELSLKKGS